MTEARKYPEREHYEFPRDTCEQIAEELRLYPDHRSFRNFVTGLGHMYGDAPLMKSFQKYSVLMNIARVETGGVADNTYMDKDFCYGTLVSTHMMLAPSPVSLRRRMLHFDPLGAIDGHEEDREQMEGIVEALVNWDREEYIQLYEYQDDDMKKQIFEVTERIYGDQPNRGWDEHAFLSGFMFGMNMICRFAKQSGSTPV